jgi:hypothetical protein
MYNNDTLLSKNDSSKHFYKFIFELYFSQTTFWPEPGVWFAKNTKIVVISAYYI